ncbi:MAG: stage II sporulation protein R [Oscillospiraceae bacterium]|nr:stage II sporulation protein R [Oscillospiraceae bacterium]
MKRIELALIFGLLTALLFADTAAFGKECQQISSEVLRLHIPANSDSEADQAVKLEIRDAILARTGELFYAAGTADQAAAIAEKELAEFERIANGILREKGFSYTARAEVCRMFFATRTYGELTMPAGQYQAVRITLGEGAGQNWWCVLFPPLCLPAATETPEDSFSREEQEILEREVRYEPRFAVVEWFEQLMDQLAGIFS